MFPQAKATGLTVKDWQDIIMVNQFGKRFWDEADGSYKFFNAAMAYNGDKTKLNGGGPIWAIFDADGAAREKWNVKPPNVDPDGYFFAADTLAELAGRIKNPHQKQADARRRADRDGGALQFVRGRRRRQGLQEERPDAQDREAAVLRGVGDADPARHADRACAPTPRPR